MVGLACLFLPWGKGNPYWYTHLNTNANHCYLTPWFIRKHTYTYSEFIHTIYPIEGLKPLTDSHTHILPHLSTPGRQTAAPPKKMVSHGNPEEKTN